MMSPLELLSHNFSPLVLEKWKRRAAHYVLTAAVESLRLPLQAAAVYSAY